MASQVLGNTLMSGYKCLGMSNMRKQECYCLIVIFVWKKQCLMSDKNKFITPKLQKSTWSTCFLQRMLFIVVLPGDLVTTPHFIL